MKGVERIHSVELDMVKPFKHVIRIKDINGYTMEELPVTQTNGNAALALITKKWWEALDKIKNE